MSLTYAERTRLKAHVESLEPPCLVCGGRKWETHSNRVVAPISQLGVVVEAVTGLSVVAIVCASCRNVVLFDDSVVDE